MYGRKASQLLKDLSASGPGQLTSFDTDVFGQVIAECDAHYKELASLLKKIQEEGLDEETTRNADHFGAAIHHLAIERNKRCIMAYMYNRAETIQNLKWKVGLIIPPEVQEKLNRLEGEYFRNNSAALKSYMSEMELDLTVDMVPPKDPYIKVRVLDDIGDDMVLSDQTTNLARHSIHFLKRTDAEPLISQGLMEELVG